MLSNSRRTFLGWTALSYGRIQGASDRVRVALVGCGGRGRYVSKFMREVDGVDLVAVCDVYAPKAQEGGAKSYGDFRKVLEDRDVDAIHIATPEHWHAAITVLSIQADKHVYVEKPLAHNIREGRQMVEAAQKTKKIVLPGTQHRSAEHYAEVAQLVQSGLIGEVHFVRVWNYFNMLPNGIGRVEDSDPPQGLDWDFYLGPAPKVPFNAKRYGPTFRYFWDYCGGPISDFGVHRFDSVHQIMASDRPMAISASGGRFVLRDSGEMPDILQASYQYPSWVMSYETSSMNAHGIGGRTPGQRYYNMKGNYDRPHGEAFYGTKGTIFTDRIGYEVWFEGEKEAPRKMNTKDATALHARHFIECIRGNEKPKTDALAAHRSTNIAHLGNIAFKTRRKLVWDADKEQFAGDAEANAMLYRTPRKPWNLIG